MSRALLYTFLLSSTLLFTACQAKYTPLMHSIESGCEFYSLRSAQCLNEEQLVEKLQPYKVIFIGDHHNKESLHKKIAKLIEALSKSGTKVHLANEWFYPDDINVLKAFSNRTIDEAEFLEQIQWAKRFKHYPYSSFRPIYQAVQKSKGQLYGINLSKRDRKKISDQNLSAMTREELSFYNKLDINVAPHRTLVMPFLSHCHAPKPGESSQKCIERMYRVQVAWDSKMAIESFKLSQNLQEHEKLLIFAGSMHIQNRLGIPLRFARLGNLPHISIVPADTKTTEAENGLGDFLLFY